METIPLWDRPYLVPPLLAWLQSEDSQEAHEALVHIDVLLEQGASLANALRSEPVWTAAKVHFGSGRIWFVRTSYPSHPYRIAHRVKYDNNAQLGFWCGKKTAGPLPPYANREWAYVEPASPLGVIRAIADARLRVCKQCVAKEV